MLDHSSFDSGDDALPAAPRDTCQHGRTRRLGSEEGRAMHLPITNVGANTCAAGLMSPHSRATLTAVSGLSPVIIRHAKCAARSV